MLTRERALREATRRLGGHVREAVVRETFDQWTVSAFFRPWFPLLHVQLDDASASEAYVSMRTGEVVQMSTRAERLLAWLGPIPHWIYPAALRHQGALWRGTVLSLSALALLVSLSGLLAGLHVWRVTRRRSNDVLRDPDLRLHQGLGLLFGVFVSSWLFSGALSLSPFAWSGGAWPDEAELGLIHGASLSAAEGLPVGEALTRCRASMDVRELELVAFASNVYAVCLDGDAHARLLDLRDPALVRARLDDAQLRAVAARLSPPGGFDLSLAHEPDAYWYPSHQDDSFALPFVRIQLRDREQTTYYLDPTRLRVLARHTSLTRLERWLYHGLHSLDLPGLYQHRLLWQTVVLVAMAVGLTLSLLGLGMSLRRARRRTRVRSGSAAAEPALLEVMRAKEPS